MALSVSAGCPGPTWPKCENDDHCKASKDGNEAGKDYMCVFGQCLECGKDEHCQDGERCTEGRCESYCRGDEECGAGQMCNADGDCVAKPVVKQEPQCTSDDDCASGQACQAGTCAVAVAAQPEEDCAQSARVQFDFNVYDITDEARERLSAFANCMTSHPDWQLTIEGHADERGTTQYNLDLGEKRAQSIRSYLSGLGIARSRMKTLSYGEERPLVDASDERAWAQNRRAELSVR